MTSNSDLYTNKDYDKSDMSFDDKVAIIDELRKAMLDAAENLEFEKKRQGLGMKFWILKVHLTRN